MHEKAFKPEGIGGDAKPEDMAVDAGQLGPNCSQVERPLRHLDAHDLLDGLAVSQGVLKAAQAADPVGHMDKIDEVPIFHQSFEAPMDITYGGDGVHNLFIFRYEIEVNRLGKHRVLRSERDNAFFSHEILLYSFSAAADVSSGFDGASAFGIGAFGSLTLSTLKGVLIAVW